MKPPSPHLSKSSLSNHSHCHALSGLSDPSCWVDSTNLMTALRLRCLGGLGWRCRSWLAVLLLLGSRLCFCFVAVVLSHSPAKYWSCGGSVESHTWAQTKPVPLIHVLNQPWGVAQIKSALLSLVLIDYSANELSCQGKRKAGKLASNSRRSKLN